MTQLLFSSSPRSVWLWASDEDTVRRVRETVDHEPAYQGRTQLPLVTDIGIGVQALEACKTLASVGFTFIWHPSQHPLNRDGWPSRLPGMSATSRHD